MATGRPPQPPTEAVRRKFQRQVRVDTECELAARRAMHRRGLRYRVNLPPLQGVRRRADVVFPRQRVAVFVDGCFWHGCSEHRTIPRNNGAWWLAKIEGNRTRDRHTDELLRTAGWDVIRVWEHDDPEEVADRVEARVRAATDADGRKGCDSD